MMNRFMIVSILCGLNMVTVIQTCMITFVNDNITKVGIFNELDKTFTLITKNAKRRFGDHHKQASFLIYIQQPKKREIWTPLYSCEQNKCSGSGNIVLKLSDIQNGEYNDDLFTIREHAPHSSMVKKLLRVQKKGCYSCMEN